MIPKSFQKQFSNQHQTWIDFAPNLAPFWKVFGGQDGAKFAPRCLQDAIFFFILFLASFFIDFYPNLAPTWPQLGPNLASKSTPKFIQDPFWSEKVKKIQPKWGPNSSLSTNMSPKTPKVAPGRPHVPHFHWFLIDFWWIFDTIFIDFCWISYWFLIPF